MPDIFFTVLVFLFFKFGQFSKVPALWLLGKTVLVYKKGDPENIANYRPITMLSNLRKMFEYFILKDFNDFSDSIHPAQIGFVHGRDCYFGILTLDMILSHTSRKTPYASQNIHGQLLEIIGLSFIHNKIPPS